MAYRIGTDKGADLVAQVKKTGDSAKTTDGTILSLGKDGNVYAFQNGEKKKVVVDTPGREADGTKTSDAYMSAIRSALGDSGINITYGGSWADDEYKRLIRQALGMNYSDWAKGAEYAALKDRYSAAGKSAMQDTLGDVSARTGGLASSYATSAASQQYNEYMRLLEDAARQQFAAERNNVLENAGLVKGAADTAYGRWLDELNRQATNRDRDLSVLQYLYGAATDEDATRYARSRDAKQDEQNDQNAALAKQETAAQVMANIGDYSRYGELLGLTPAEVAALETSAAAASAPRATGGGGSYRSSSRSSSEKPKLTAAQTISAINNGIINDETRAAYEYWYGEPYEEESDEYVEDTTDWALAFRTAKGTVAKMVAEGSSKTDIANYLSGLEAQGMPEYYLEQIATLYRLS